MIILNFIQLAFVPIQWLFKFFKKQIVNEINKDIAQEEIQLMKSRITFLESQIQDMQLKILLQNTEQEKIRYHSQALKQSQKIKYPKNFRVH